jgi:hypothetical protein
VPINLNPIPDEECASIVLKEWVRSLKFHSGIGSVVKPETLSQFGRGLITLEIGSSPMEIFSKTGIYLDALITLFNNCMISLVSLNIHFRSQVSFKDVVKQLPTFKNLEHLSLELYSHYCQEVTPVADIRDFFSKFPKLSHLHVTDNGDEYPLKALSNSLLTPFRNNLTNLQWVMSSKTIPLDVGIFPNLVELHVWAAHWHQMDALLAYMQPLEHLEKITLDGYFDFSNSGQAFSNGPELISRLMGLKSLGLQKILVSRQMARDWNPHEQVLSELKKKFNNLGEGELQNSSGWIHHRIVNVLSVSK